MKKRANKMASKKTIGGQTKGKQRATNKNDNNEKNEKNIINSSSIYNKDIAKIDELMIECLNTTNTNNINECIEYLDKLPIDVIEYALKKTSRIDRPSWKYAMSILDSYVDNGITTLEKIKADELNFKSKNKSQKKEETFEEQVERYKREWGLEDED
jgi:DnaD/phage-associated family protein